MNFCPNRLCHFVTPLVGTLENIGRNRMLHHNPVTINSMELLFEATDLFSIYLDDGVDFSLPTNFHQSGDFIFEIVNYIKSRLA